MDEDESEQEDSSVHSSSVRSDSSGRIKKNKRGRPAKKKKKSMRCSFLSCIFGFCQSVRLLKNETFQACFRRFSYLCPPQSLGKRRAMVTRRTIRTIARCVSRVERSSCATLVLELTTWSAWSPSWTRPPRASGAARTA